MDGNRLLSSNVSRLAIGLLPLLLWTAVHRSTLSWWIQSFAAAEPTNLALLISVVAVLFYGLGAKSPDKSASIVSFQPQPQGIALTLACAFADLILRHALNLPQLSVCLFILGAYGLLSGIMTRQAWRRSLPAAVLVAFVLPFGARFGTGLGYPARVLTARLVEQVLATLNIGSLSVHDIILLENGIAHVDLPCSGLKSLWTGSLFFLAATWTLGRRLSLRWLAACGLFQGLLLAANALRVVILVLLSLVLELPRLARVVHVPLGVFGFLSCCFIGTVLLRLVPVGDSAKHRSPKSHPRFRYAGLGRRHMGWFLVPLSLLIVAMPPLPQSSGTPAGVVVAPPVGVGFEALELTPIERSFFITQPGATARKAASPGGA